MTKLRTMCLLLAGACVPPAAREASNSATGPKAVQPGDTVQGMLPAHGPRLGNRGVFQAFRLTADSGSTYRVSVTATDFDPVVRIGRLVDGVPDIVITDDDGGEGLNALAILNAPASGEYIVVVHPSGGTGSGAYTLVIFPSGEGTAQRTPEENAAPVGSIRRVQLGETVRDTLRENNYYGFHASAGQNLRLTLSSGAFDTYLSLGRIAEGRFRADTTDDDGGDGLNSLLEVTIANDGEYVARVTSVDTANGPFTLRMIDRANLPASAPVTSRPALIGTELAGVFDARSPTLESGAPFDQWEITAVEGATYVVTLRSTDFDPLLSVGENRENEYRQLWHNDDAAGLGINSRVSFTAARAGSYLVRPQPYRAGSLGQYTLRVEWRQPPRSSPVSKGIPAGGEAAGTLDDTDARLADGSSFQHWVFSARAGERITLLLRSSADDFDPFLAVGIMDGTRFVELSSNDDFGEGAAARVVFVAPTAGEYVARVNTFGPEQSGAYTLRLDRER